LGSVGDGRRGGMRKREGLGRSRWKKKRKRRRRKGRSKVRTFFVVMIC